MEAVAGDDGAFFSDVLSLLLLDVDAHGRADDAPCRELFAPSVPGAQDASPPVKSGAIEHRSTPATPEPTTLELCASPAEDAVRRDREEPHPPTKKRKKNAYRERMKSEMAALRQREFALEGQLRDLQQRRQQALLCPARHAGEERFQAWKSIAMQHRDALALARQRNLALQTAVGRQIMVIEQLQSLLLVNATDAVALGAATTQLTLQTDQQARRRSPINSSDEELLLAYVEQLDAAIHSTDRVLGESALRLGSPEPAMLAIRPKRSADGSEFFEITETTVLSLEFDRVRHDAWQIFASLYPNRLDRAAVPEDTIVGKVDVAGDNYNLTIHFAARKFEPHEGRLVLVWKALTIGDGEFAGMNSDETGWTDLRPKGSQATVSHSCLQIVPIFSVLPASVKAKRFMEHLMRCGDDDVMTIAQMMESVLLHDPTGGVASEHTNVTPAA